MEGPRTGNVPKALKIIDLTGQQGVREFKSLDHVRTIIHPNLVTIHGCWLKNEAGKVLDDTLFEMEARERTISRTAAQGAAVVDLGKPVELLIAMDLGLMSMHNLLEKHQSQGRPGIPPEELLEYMNDAAKAIDFLNRDCTPPIVHGDIKPHNLLLFAGQSVKICDYGLCKAHGIGPQGAHPDANARDGRLCTPELFVGDPNPKSDQYSLAITYVELRTGRLPFTDEVLQYAVQVMRAHQNGRLQLSRLNPQVRAVIKRATSRDPNNRWPSARDMVRQLKNAEGITSSIFTPIAPPPPLPPEGDERSPPLPIAPDSKRRTDHFAETTVKLGRDFAPDVDEDDTDLDADYEDEVAADEGGEAAIETDARAGMTLPPPGTKRTSKSSPHKPSKRQTTKRPPAPAPPRAKSKLWRRLAALVLAAATVGGIGAAAYFFWTQHRGTREDDIAEIHQDVDQGKYGAALDRLKQWTADCPQYFFVHDLPDLKDYWATAAHDEIQRCVNRGRFDDEGRFEAVRTALGPPAADLPLEPEKVADLKKESAEAIKVVVGRLIANGKFDEALVAVAKYGGDLPAKERTAAIKAIANRMIADRKFAECQALIAKYQSAGASSAADVAELHAPFIDAWKRQISAEVASDNFAEPMSFVKDHPTWFGADGPALLATIRGNWLKGARRPSATTVSPATPTPCG